VKGIDISKMEGMNMLEEHDHPLNHRPGEEGMNMVNIHMVDVKGMNILEEHLSKKVEDMHMVEKHPTNHRSEVGGMDIMEDMMIDMVER
jgi:hypothetical protein